MSSTCIWFRKFSVTLLDHRKVSPIYPKIFQLQSKLDANAVHYCLVVSTQRNQRSLCAALVGTSPTQWLAALRLDNHSKPFQRHNTADTNAASSTAVPSMAPHVHDNGGPLVICTGRQSRQQLNGMQPNRRYFIDVFGVHTRRDGLTFRMASTSVWFNRSQPQPLADGEVVTTRLAELGRMTVFSYRVAAHAAAAASGANVTLVQVLPCGIGLLVKVFRRKVPLVQQELDRPTVLRVPDTRPGDRLVIKVSTADRYEFRRSQRMGVSYIGIIMYFDCIISEIYLLRYPFCRLPSPSPRASAPCPRCPTTRPWSRSSPIASPPGSPGSARRTCAPCATA